MRTNMLVTCLAIVGAFAIGLIAGGGLRKPPALELVKDASADAPAPLHPKCTRERRMHAWGTYQAPNYHDYPLDLQISECLEWEPK